MTMHGHFLAGHGPSVGFQEAQDAQLDRQPCHDQTELQVGRDRSKDDAWASVLTPPSSATDNRSQTLRDRQVQIAQDPRLQEGQAAGASLV